MLDKLVQEFVKPMLRRVGSMVAGAILVLGATPGQIGEVEAAVVALLTVALDLFLSYRNRKA